MIEYFIKPRHRQDLASCAVIYPLFAGLSLLVPMFAYPVWCSMLSPDASGGWRGVPFWAWMVWMLGEWGRLVALVRAEPERRRSIRVFHHIQVACLLLFSGHLLMAAADTRLEYTHFLTIWIIAVEVAMVVFFVNYFLLALWTWTRLSWHAPAGFAFVVVSLAFEITSAVRGPRWWVH